MAMGRPQKPYHASWGELIQGLYKCPDGRWRINATGQKFTESDERRAVQRFRDATRQEVTKVRVPFARTNNVDQLRELVASKSSPKPVPVLMPDPTIPPWEPQPVWQEDAVPTWMEAVEGAPAGTYEFYREPLAEDAVWGWVRRQLSESPAYAAKMLGVPEENVRNLPIPRPSAKLATILEKYKTHNPSYKKGRTRAVQIFEKMMEHTKAVRLDDLTQTALAAWRDSIENDADITSAQTKVWMYGQVKSVLAFALKTPDTDTAQVRAALDRMKILWTPDEMPTVQPRPISREHFHKLLDAGNGTWRAWLLMGLNAALYIEELCDLKWSDLDLERGTYAAIREKTRKKRIPRAATLWPETVEALKKLERRGNSPYVFTSPHGTRYASSRSRCNAFADLRTKAGVPEEVSFATIKDAAYTAACTARIDDKWARVLAGHRADGLQDNYVLRHPEIVRPACDAVYAAYGPFPSPLSQN